MELQQQPLHKHSEGVRVSAVDCCCHYLPDHGRGGSGGRHQRAPHCRPDETYVRRTPLRRGESFFLLCSNTTYVVRSSFSSRRRGEVARRRRLCCSRRLDVDQINQPAANQFDTSIISSEFAATVFVVLRRSHQLIARTSPGELLG